MTDFSKSSGFVEPDLSTMRMKMSESVLNPVQAAQSEEIALPLTTVRQWWRDMEDALWEFEDGTAAGLERGISELERIRNEIEEAVREHATS